MSGSHSACRLLRCALFSALVLVSPLLRAGDFFQPILPEEMKVTSVPEQPGAPAVVLLREEIADDKLHYQSVQMRIKILSEAGRKYADVQIPFDRHNVTVGDVHGRTVRPDGTVINFEGKPLEKVVAKGRDLKVIVKAFTLPDVQVGSIIEYYYTTRYDDNRAYAPHWILQHELFQRKARFRFIPYDRDLILEHERIGRGVAYTARLPKGAEIKEFRGRYEVEFSDLSGFEDELYMPPDSWMKPFISFFYRAGNFQPEEFWKDEGKYWSKEVEHFVGKRAGIAAALPTIVASTDTPEQKVRKIYDFVGTLENTTYLPERTLNERLSLGLKPNAGAEDVLRQKTGDRDELVRLFVAMVREAGIPAQLMIVTNREKTFFEPKLLSWRQLDNEIAIVNLNGKEVFLDPGTRFCPYGLLNWKFTITRGIRQIANGTQIAQTPEPVWQDSMIQRVSRLTLNHDNGELEGRLLVQFSGQAALVRRLEAVTTDETGRSKNLTDEIRSWLPANAEVTITRQPVWDKANLPLTAELKIVAPMAAGAGKRVLLPVSIFDVNQAALFTHTERHTPIYFHYTTRMVDETHIKLPPSLQVESLPETQTIKLDYAYYKSERENKAGEILSTRDFLVAGLGFPVKDYADLKGFYDKVKAADDQQAILRSVLNAQSN